MSKKKLDDNYYNENYDFDDDLNYDEPEESSVDSEPIYNDPDTSMINPVQLAEKTLKVSETVKNFKELPPELRVSFLNTEESKEVKHQARNYRNYLYIKKVLDLQRREDEKLIKHNKNMYAIKNKEQLKHYLKSTNRFYLYNILEESGEIDNIINYLKTLKPSGLEQDFYNIAHNLKSVYSEYNEDNIVPEYIDDTGFIGEIATSAVVSSGRQGNERFALISTVASTRNMDLRKETEIKEEKSGFMDKVKNTARRFI